MKSTRKHELQTNELADAIWHLIERARPHAQVIGYGVLGVLVLILVMVVLPTFRSSAAGRNPAADAFAEAQTSGQIQPLRDFLKDYPEAPQAPAARLLLADRDLAEVVRGIQAGPGEDTKAKAASLLTEAKDFYTQLAASSSPVMEPLARAGLAAPAPAGGPRAGPIGSATAARAELRAAGFADVDAWEPTLHYPFGRAETRALFVEYDRAAELDALSPPVRAAVLAALDAALARLPDEAFPWDAPLVAARAVRSRDD